MLTTTMKYKKTLTACLVSLALSACGESDLVELQERELDDARQMAQSPTLGPANPLDGDTGASDSDGGTTGSSTGGTTGGSADGTTGTATAGNTDGQTTVAGTDGSTGGDTSSQGSGNTSGDSGESGNGVDLTGYDLVFEDEFRSATIDESKWNTALTWGPDLIVYDQLQYYIDLQNSPDFGYNPFNLNGEELTITAIETPDNLRAAANEQPWLSGVLTTADTFSFTYGYIETSVNTQEGLGVWPAFWMLSREFEGLKPELFIMEYNGSKPDSLFHNYNYQDADGNLRSPGQWEVISEEFSEGFHKVGVAWSPEELLFYIDDEPRYRIVGENVSKQDMYLILNLAIGGNWPGAPDGTTPTPASIVIDYVRVYQLKP